MSINGGHSATKKGTNGNVDLKAKGKTTAPARGSNGAGGDSSKLQRITSR